LKNYITKSVDRCGHQKNPFKVLKLGTDMITDLLKYVVDQITLVSASEKTNDAQADLIDVWFDSGSMPYAQWHYHF
jgi:isoleucyl-tRNA synthetase